MLHRERNCLDAFLPSILESYYRVYTMLHYCCTPCKRKVANSNLYREAQRILSSKIQWSPDLTNRSGPSRLFVKPGYSLNPNFLWSKKSSGVKTDALNLDDSLKPNSLNSASTVVHCKLIFKTVASSKKDHLGQSKIGLYNRLVSLSEIVCCMILGPKKYLSL